MGNSSKERVYSRCSGKTDPCWFFFLVFCGLVFFSFHSMVCAVETDYADYSCRIWPSV